MRWFLVSTFFASSTQQIHSFRASGVISSHAAIAPIAEVRTFRKSAGAVCTTPGESFVIKDFVIEEVYQMKRTTRDGVKRSLDSKMLDC